LFYDSYREYRQYEEALKGFVSGDSYRISGLWVTLRICNINSDTKKVLKIATSVEEG